MGHTDELGYDYLDITSGLKRSKLKALAALINERLINYGFEAIDTSHLIKRTANDQSCCAFRHWATRENRQKNLANKLKKARQSAEKLAERVIDLDKVTIAEDKQAEFDEQWQAFEKQLKNDLQCRTTSTYAHGYNAGIKQIQQQIEA